MMYVSIFVWFQVTLAGATHDTEGRRVSRGQGVEVQLKNVLIVEKLPVPLHISTRADPSLLQTGAFRGDFSEGTLMLGRNFPYR